MGWFRSRSTWGSYLALFALAFQLVLSFGHVHLDGDHVPGLERSALLGVHASTVATAAADPAGKESPALPDDCCPICTLIHLAGTLVAAEPPSLPRLAAFGRAPLEAAIHFELAGSRHHSPLGARAPPLA
ncbi:MAG: DUF2946 family protein [Xanthobacteraceae bacterium]